jgi:alpha-N-arabinofuranosidase
MRFFCKLVKWAFASMLFLCGVAVNAQSPLPVYTDNLVNGFQDWGWATHNYANTAPVHSGSDSVSVTISTANYDGLQIYHSDFDSTPYSSLSFWINGGAGGGQLLQVYGLVHLGSTNNFGQLHVSLANLQTNIWQQITIPLSSLGVANATNFTGFVIQSRVGAIQPTYYLDDIQLNANPAPALVHIGVNAAQSLRTVDARWFGINIAMWDNYFDTPQTIARLAEMGTLALRCMGGSLSDEYNWSTDISGTNTWMWQTSFANLLHVATNINAQVVTTVNYGTGSSNEAAAWVAYANGSITNTVALGTDQFGVNWATVGYWASLRAAAPLASDDGKNFLRIARTAPLGFKYWEIGNECYGTWETDSNAVPHDPYTYATRARDYLAFMKSVDATIKIGVVVAPGEDSYSNNANHYAVNPRTTQAHYGWTPVMLATLKTFGVTPDFAIHHSYPPGDCDPALLQFAEGVSGWASDAASLRQMFTDYMGGAGSNVELCVTENNTGSSGKQLTSLVNGIYVADSLGNLMKTEFNSFFWWDLRNGISSGDNDPTIYGWRLYGDEGVLGGLTNGYPTFYVTKLLQYFARPGDMVLNVTSDYSLLSAYAVRRASGAVTLLVLHKDPTTNFTAQISINGFVPTNTATLLSYGMPQDIAAETGTGSPDLARTNFVGAGATFNYTFTPYSVSLFTLTPPAPALVALPTPQQPGQAVFQLQGQSDVRYVIQNSTDLASWNSVATNTLSSSTLNVTNAISPDVPVQFWRAVWQP